MKGLFEYGNAVDRQHFVGREEEISRLSADFMFLTNTVVVAPQGWGKTSLVLQAARSACAKEPKLRFCHVDLSTVRDEERFLILLAQNVLRAVSDGIEDAVSNVSVISRGLSQGSVSGTVRSVKSLLISIMVMCGPIVTFSLTSLILFQETVVSR